MTNAVIYYSNTNQSLRIAKYLADKLDYALLDIDIAPYGKFDSVVVIFPIHCQNLPDKVKVFLTSLQADNITIIATYGRMNHGNVLFEIQRKYKLNIIAGAYVPTRHSYLLDNEFDDFKSLEPIIEKVKAPSPVSIPSSYKNPLSNFLPKQRSQIGVKITKNAKCNDCGLCNKICKQKAITNGVVNKNCIRCLKCINLCPNNALEFKLSLPMKAYLKKKKQDNLIIYI